MDIPIRQVSALTLLVDAPFSFTNETSALPSEKKINTKKMPIIILNNIIFPVIPEIAAGDCPGSTNQMYKTMNLGFMLMDPGQSPAAISGMTTRSHPISRVV